MQRRTIPASIIIGVAFAVAGSCVLALAAALFLGTDSFEDGSYKNFLRWRMFGSGASLAATLLIASGLFWIASRLSRWQRTVTLISAWIHVGYLGWSIAYPFLNELISSAETMELFEKWIWRLVLIVGYGGLVLITIAARAWWKPRSSLVVVAAIVLVILESLSWLPFLSSWIHELNENHRMIYRTIWPIREILSDAALLVVIHALMQDTTEPLPDPNGATAWFRRAEATIIIRIVAAVLLAVIGVARAPGAAKLVFVAGPLLAILCILGFGWCLASVDRAAIPGMPRIRLLIGAAIAAWGAGVQVLQAAGMYGALKDERSSGFDDEMIGLWSIGAPLISATGIVLVCSAIASFATTRNDQPLREMAIARAIIHAVLVVIVMLLPYGIAKATEAGTLIMLSLVLAGCAIASLVVLAGLMRRAGDAIGTVPEIPEARLR